MLWRQTSFRVLGVAALIWLAGSAAVTASGVADSMRTVLSVSRGAETTPKDCSHLADIGREACNFENDKREGRLIRYGFAMSTLWSSSAIVLLPTVALVLVGGVMGRSRARAQASQE